MEAVFRISRKGSLKFPEVQKKFLSWKVYLIPFSLHLREFVDSLLIYPHKRIVEFEGNFLVSLRIFDPQCHGQIHLKVAPTM